MIEERIAELEREVKRLRRQLDECCELLCCCPADDDDGCGCRAATLPELLAALLKRLAATA